MLAGEEASTKCGVSEEGACGGATGKPRPLSFVRQLLGVQRWPMRASEAI